MDQPEDDTGSEGPSDSGTGPNGGTLYVVATPIGNLEDISARALRVLASAALIAAEDTRTTAKLLRRYELHVPMISYFEGNARRRLSQILATLSEGGDVALVSEAGTPVISDPGADLVRATASVGHRVLPVPGPSAVAAILSVAGFSADRFTFLGFLPRKAGERRRAIDDVAEQTWPIVLYESPYRVRKTLEALGEALGDREVVVGRELTKLHEEVFRGSLADALDHFASPRGEFTIVIAGAPRRRRGHANATESESESAP